MGHRHAKARDKQEALELHALMLQRQGAAQWLRVGLARRQQRLAHLAATQAELLARELLLVAPYARRWRRHARGRAAARLASALHGGPPHGAGGGPAAAAARLAFSPASAEHRDQRATAAALGGGLSGRAPAVGASVRSPTLRQPLPPFREDLMALPPSPLQAPGFVASPAGSRAPTAQASQWLAGGVPPATPATGAPQQHWAMSPPRLAAVQQQPRVPAAPSVAPTAAPLPLPGSTWAAAAPSGVVAPHPAETITKPSSWHMHGPAPETSSVPTLVHNWPAPPPLAPPLQPQRAGGAPSMPVLTALSPAAAAPRQRAAPRMPAFLRDAGPGPSGGGGDGGAGGGAYAGVTSPALRPHSSGGRDLAQWLVGGSQLQRPASAPGADPGPDVGRSGGSGLPPQQQAWQEGAGGPGPGLATWTAQLLEAGDDELAGLEAQLQQFR